MGEFTVIYALCHPITNEIRYVGKTIDPTKRYKKHCYKDSKTHKSNWIRSLKPNKPLLIELESVEDWVESEQFWISYFRALGARLTNQTKGGEGVPGFKPNLATKEKLSKAQMGNKKGVGRVHSEEMRRKISESLKGNKNGAGNKGKDTWNKGGQHSEETKVKISLAVRGANERIPS